MCFLLYAGTDRPLQRSPWNVNDPHVHVRDIGETESWTAAIFSKPEIQYIGSSTSCGCAFPSVMYQNGDWPYWLDPVVDADVIADEKSECNELCQLLSELDEIEIELYGVWAGNKNQEEGPAIREEITLDDIRSECFRFKEGGFYRVRLR